MRTVLIEFYLVNAKFYVKIYAFRDSFTSGRAEHWTPEHSKCLLIAMPNRICLTHLVKQSAYKELMVNLLLALINDFVSPNQ